MTHFCTTACNHRWGQEPMPIDAPWIWNSAPPPCNHCYCINESDTAIGSDHMRCCNCGNRQAMLGIQWNGTTHVQEVTG